jgi:Family of unknown function (DUF5926)/SEC-C motif
VTRRARARRAPAASRGTSTAALQTDGVMPRQPCPCGSGKRFKNCHGRQEDLVVTRPFDGREDEGDWIALRELVPAATAPLRLADPAHADRTVTLATVLPLALAGVVRDDGRVLVGLQVHGRSGDVSRDIAHVLEQALVAEPGTMLSATGAPGRGPRLQDLLDPAPIEVTVHDDFGFWLDGAASEPTAEVQASLERANSAIIPTRRLTSVRAAYWCDTGEKAHLRWVMTDDEDRLLDAMARLAAANALDLGEGTRYAGSFRAHGRLVPVWDLPREAKAEDWEEPAVALRQRLDEVLADTSPLTDEQRRSRDGLRGRQLSLR